MLMTFHVCVGRKNLTTTLVDGQIHGQMTLRTSHQTRDIRRGKEGVYAGDLRQSDNQD